LQSAFNCFPATSSRSARDPYTLHYIDSNNKAGFALSGRTPILGALRMLKIAIDHNYCSYPAMDKDPFFSGLRGNAQLQKLRQSGLACHEGFVNNRETTPLAAAGVSSKQP
jgi:hypothetical protein